MTVGIVAVGGAAPSLRLAAGEIASAWSRRAGRGQVALCSADEDTLTLAWSAGDAALRAASLDGNQIDGLWWGTTRPPFAEGPSHATLAASLGLGSSATGAMLAGSSHSGIEALFGAADAVAAGSARTALVIVSDALRPGPGTTFETRCGAGAAAVILTRQTEHATLGPRVTRTQPLLDQYRGDSELDTRDAYDGRLFREEIFMPLVGDVAAAVGTLEPRAWSLPDPDGRMAAALTKRLGAPAAVSSSVYAAVGDTGAAAALLGAIAALDAAGEIAVVAYGGGRASAVTVTALAPVPGAALVAGALNDEPRNVSYAEALRARGQLVPNGETVPMGVPPGSAMFVRGAHELLGLLGAKCVDCGTINTPPSIHPHCIACGGPKMEPVELAREGTVHTYVINHTMPAPFEAPLPIAVIDLDDGARIMLQVADDGSHVAIGARMRLVLRRYAHERGVPIYGFKAKPLRSDSVTAPANGGGQ
jgi:hydroxymethylglutaryl-CoA synthase